MKDLTDFAVIARSASTGLIENLTGKDTVLRVVPLENAPLLSEALGGLPLKDGNALFNADQNMTLEANGSISDSNIHSVQDRGNGYVRVVAHINNEAVPDGEGGSIEPLSSALGFALLNQDEKGDWKVLAVASLKDGCDLTDGCYVAFTFSKTNNYQSVSFSPNAFATIEDLNNINGLDGLHIAFDHASGDIKLLDKDGNVLDQANLHMDADTIIADGEEGYKYVKTDVQQDIHAEKDFMPAGHTAQNSVDAEYYAPKTACFLVEVDDEVVSDGTTTNPIASARQAVEVADETALAQAKSALAALELAAVESLSIEAIRKGDSDAIKGIRVYTGTGNQRSSNDYVLSEDYDLITGSKGQFLKSDSPVATQGKALIEVYSPDAFVWTVGSDVGEAPKEGVDDHRTFAQKMNAAAASMRFHVGDDIPLGSYIATLIGNGSGAMNETNGSGFDAEKFMHEGTDSDYIDELVDAQRALAKEELVEWNKQHPALVRDDANGTRISENGLDVRNGSIQIGNAKPLGESVKRYVLETDIEDSSAGARADKGLQIGVIDSQNSGGNDVKKDILTINAEDYISGAPTCLALLKCEKAQGEGGVAGEGSSDIVEASAERITANFTASGEEDGGVFTLTITDNRANNGFGGVPRIVEIIPVYKSGADASEAVPAQRSISAIATATLDQSTLSIQCSQVLDWAQSIDLGGTVEAQDGETGAVSDGEGGYVKPNGMELYLIVKVY